MIKFGPSGNGENFYNLGLSGASDSAKYVKDLGLNCFEYSFGRGITLTKTTAENIGNEFLKNGVELSIHAPYFINFATTEEDKEQNSYNYVINSLKYAKIMNAKRVVFHPSTQGKLDRQTAVELTHKRLVNLANLIVDANLDDLIICPETMGKSKQIGTVEEIANFCTIAPFYVPAIDFGHVNSRENGSLNTVDDFLNVLKTTKEIIGEEKLNKLHIHFSKIMYGDKGEIKHLTFEDSVYGPNFEPLAKALKIMNIEPFIICESAGTQDIDAVKMKQIYLNV